LSLNQIHRRPILYCGAHVSTIRPSPTPMHSTRHHRARGMSLAGPLPTTRHMPRPTRPPALHAAPQQRTSPSFFSPPPAPFSECRHASHHLSFPFARCRPRLACRAPLPPLSLSSASVAGPPPPLVGFHRNHSHHHRLPRLTTATMARRAPSSAELPSGTPPTSGSCRSHPGR
jgi:hypothetical protein